MKAYSTIPIQDCGEPLVPIPRQYFVLTTPHPYESLGAPYGVRSPYVLRQSVCDRLIQAHHYLQDLQPGWRIQIFDAYRPIAVQQFMVDSVFADQVAMRGLSHSTLTDAQRTALLEEVYTFWAKPSHDPATPPPHSTGAAVDVTLIDAKGDAVEMGSPIDEISERSHPNYFAPSYAEGAADGDRLEHPYHVHRSVLRTVLCQAGFHQHPNEWWHFSYGDQLWAWIERQHGTDTAAIARYGRATD
ncbi:MAG: M15 family metallopeptidase [Synechococcales cyanobacterium T60_A2020_003]|nr:M15 family metallopeptidase [Synechococcales cyanobacterium T60_A2020_003]